MTILQLQEKVYKMGEKIDVNKDSELYPYFCQESDIDNRGISVYINDEGYNYLSMERGHINEHIVSKNIDDIVYVIFDSITFTFAKEYELKNRKMDEDFRRQLFRKQLELMRCISTKYAEILESEHNHYLEISPFRDSK